MTEMPNSPPIAPGYPPSQSATLPPVRVFLSYSWDSPDHKQRVLGLAQRLRSDGVDAWMDSFTPFPEDGWARWMENEIEHARFVIVVATPKYAQRFAGQTTSGKGSGATWEGAIITQDLYESGGRTCKYLPVVFSPEAAESIPKPLRKFTRFCLNTDEGYEDLYRQITGQPRVTPALIGARRDLPANALALAPGPIANDLVHAHVTTRSNLPRLSYGFYGRETELQRIAAALEPRARTWGALIDGPGGIGKTALAIRAAELTPPGQFERVIFLSAKSRELTCDGERALSTFVQPGYGEMLAQLARELEVWDDIRTRDENERGGMLQRALRDERALLVFDNLESLPSDDRNRLFDFLNQLPPRCKAIVTSRRRTDVAACLVRLDKLGRDAAFQLITELSRDQELLSKISEPERQELYERTGGNPLLIRWIAGQLGRGSCRNITSALDLLSNSPTDNDPLEFVFGDLAETFTQSETHVLSALCHFTFPTEVKFIAELAGLSTAKVETALRDLMDRALINGDVEARRFAMMPLASIFLRRAKPESVQAAGVRLTGDVYALAIENGKDKHDRYPLLEGNWPKIEAGLPLLLDGPNDRLQTVCDALRFFLEFSGRWDELLSLSHKAEAKAVAAKAFLSAGWRAENAAWVYNLRGQSTEVFNCVTRAEDHWRKAKATAREKAVVVRLRAIGHRLEKHYEAAITEYRRALECWRTLAPNSDDVANGLNDLAGVERLAGRLAEAETHYQEAWRIWKVNRDSEGLALCTGSLAALALDREDWTTAETRARHALKLVEHVGRKEKIASNSATLAEALVRQQRSAEALPYARVAVDLFTKLGSPELPKAQQVLAECQPK